MFLEARYFSTDVVHSEGGLIMKKHFQTKTVDDISDDWTNNSGLLLENDTSKENEAGQYTGTLNWTAINSL